MQKVINYFHAKFQINILKNKKDIKLLELWQLCFKKETRPKDLKCCRNHSCLLNNLLNLQFGPKFWLINELIKLINSLINLNLVFLIDPNCK